MLNYTSFFTEAVIFYSAFGNASKTYTLLIFDTINDNNYTIILDRIDVNLELPKDIIDVFDGKRQNNENVEILAKINIELTTIYF